MAYKMTSNVVKLQYDNEVSTSLFLRFLLDYVHKVSGPITPRDKGDLTRDVLKTVSGKKGVIQWRKEYAIFQEDKQHMNYTTPGTGSKFAERGAEAGIKNADELLKRAKVY